jgi:deferrochelatase/peroxidase EfeB
MFGSGGDGLSDRLTEFSRPVAGACYFAPSLNALAAVDPMSRLRVARFRATARRWRRCSAASAAT